MSKYNDPQLHIQVLCSDCRSPLVTSATKLHNNAHFAVEVLVDQCESCRPTTIENFQMVLNDSERIAVSVDFK